jgi:hypothetical protein
MPGNAVTVTVSGGTTTTVTVPGSTGTPAPTITNGGTANVAVTSVGDRGPKGDSGPANALTIGTVITGAAQSNASATITGTPPSQTLSLVIPRGDTGPSGTNGTNGTSGTFADAQSITSVTSNYTLVLSDAGKLIAANHASTSINITVPAGASVNFPLGTHIDVARLGAATVTVVGDPGVTVNATPGRTLRAQYSAGTLIEVAADTWLFVGDLTQ